MQPGSVPSSWAGPLQGIRVLDFTRVLAGPAASVALADLGAEVLKVEPPETGDETRLIYCAISGFGMTGPLRDRPSFDIVLQALSGALSVNGEPERPPTKLGIPLRDLVGGVTGPMGILAALYERSVSGPGRVLDITLFT